MREAARAKGGTEAEAEEPRRSSCKSGLLLRQDEVCTLLVWTDIRKIEMTRDERRSRVCHEIARLQVRAATVHRQRECEAHACATLRPQGKSSGDG